MNKGEQIMKRKYRTIKQKKEIKNLYIDLRDLREDFYA